VRSSPNFRLRGKGTHLSAQAQIGLVLCGDDAR
jgi:hypothetical protein